MPKPEQQDIRSWIRRITDNEMPIFGRTVQEVVSVSENDESSAAQLGQVVLKDAAMTSRVLKLANSVYYNRSGQKFSTISRAIMMLGFDTVRSMCLTVALIDSLVQGIHREHLVREMARSLHAATQARMIAEDRGDPSPEEVFISTLLLHIGDLAFWCFSKETGKKLDAALRQPGVTPEKAQREVLGFSLNELSAGLAKEWSLSELLQTTLKNPGSTDGRTRSVVLSHKLAKAAEQGWKSSEVLRLTEELAKLTKTKPERITEKLHQGAKQAVQSSSYYGAESVAQVIPLPAQYSADEMDSDDVVAQQYPEPDAGLQLQILRELTGLAAQTTDFNVVMEMILEGIHRGVGMDRALFSLMTPDRKSLRVKYALGDEGDHLRRHFNFPLNRQNAEILLYCMEQEQPLWLDPKSPPELSRKMSSRLTEATGTPSFFIAPILVKGKVIGLFYADRCLSRRTLDQESFDSFQHFTQQSNLVLHLLATKR